MTFDCVSNSYSTLSQPLNITASCVCSYNHLAHPLQMQQHHLSPSARHQCSRFCCFEPLNDGVFQCQTSGQTHICGQDCHERVFLNEQFDICRFSKNLFPIRTQHASASRKRARDGAQHTSIIKRKAPATYPQSFCPDSVQTASVDCNSV